MDKSFLKAILLPVASAILILAFSPKASAVHVIRLDNGVFNGRIANTTSGTTYPLNTPSSTFNSFEFEYGNPKWRFLLGGTMETYTAKMSGVTSTPFTYGDFKIGAVYATSCCEWRFIYSRYQTPYTYTYQTFDPANPLSSSTTALAGVVPANYFRVESIMYAKAQSFRLAFHYYFAAMLSPVDVPAQEINSNGNQSLPGQLTSNYFLGGCARTFAGGDKFRIGPSICVDLQEMYLPNSVVVFRQEVGARLTMEF